MKALIPSPSTAPTTRGQTTDEEKRRTETLKQVDFAGWREIFPDFDERLAKCHAEQEALRPQVKALFGVDDRDNVREYWKIVQESAECDGCKGDQCQKNRSKYQHVKAILLNGYIQPCYYRCEVGIRRFVAQAAKDGALPARYMSKTFDDYEVTAENERAVKMARWFIDTQAQRSLYLYGNTGTGKTFLTALIAKAFVKNMRHVVFSDVPTLLEDIKRSFDKGGTEELFRRCSDCDLLVLDDLGAGKITDWTNDVIYRIVNERYNAEKPLIVTSNYDLQNLQRVMSKADEFTGKRIVSRLAEMCVQAFLGTSDRRISK